MSRLCFASVASISVNLKCYKTAEGYEDTLHLKVESSLHKEVQPIYCHNSRAAGLQLLERLAAVKL